MSEQRPVRITAQVTITGPAEEILADVQRLKGGLRAVNLRVETARRQSWPDYFPPEIKGGQTQLALEMLNSLEHQTQVSPETAQRLERLIREFGRFTQ